MDSLYSYVSKGVVMVTATTWNEFLTELWNSNIISWNTLIALGALIIVRAIVR
jgi:hypothetical protein